MEEIDEEQLSLDFGFTPQRSIEAEFYQTTVKHIASVLAQAIVRCAGHALCVVIRSLLG